MTFKQSAHTPGIRARPNKFRNGSHTLRIPINQWEAGHGQKIIASGPSERQPITQVHAVVDKIPHALEVDDRESQRTEAMVMRVCPGHAEHKKEGAARKN